MRFVPGRTTRTRWLLATGTAAACAAVVAAGTVAANAAAERAPKPNASAGQAAATPPPAGSGLSPEGTDLTEDEMRAAVDRNTSAAPRPPAVNPKEPEATPLGEIIPSGLNSADGEWVFYGVAVTQSAEPDVDFGIMAGRRVAGGVVTADVMANEVEGSATAPGFHAVSGSMNVDYRDTPTFGYYAGPAAKITAKIGSRTVTASQAAWSENPSVVVFWFAPKSTIKNLTAFDAAGKKLPTGNSEVSVG
ncbi:hypothetical protein [Actinoplanes italicus]|uniref:Lipoprotein n=1 Tax=Actinoplanes italicus TaxID=113567 RepID=A0A2T0K616_9ACTN|nr:hypothetical protein [Actinoplanes italicus]PRX18422.1 hypothetical protein CLV67_113259 [Actinoplanes italicus]